MPDFNSKFPLTSNLPMGRPNDIVNLGDTLPKPRDWQEELDSFEWAVSSGANPGDYNSNYPIMSQVYLHGDGTVGFLGGAVNAAMEAEKAPRSSGAIGVSQAGVNQNIAFTRRAIDSGFNVTPDEALLATDAALKYGTLTDNWEVPNQFTAWVQGIAYPSTIRLPVGTSMKQDMEGNVPWYSKMAANLPFLAPMTAYDYNGYLASSGGKNKATDLTVFNSKSAWNKLSKVQDPFIQNTYNRLKSLGYTSDNFAQSSNNVDFLRRVYDTYIGAQAGGYMQSELAQMNWGERFTKNTWIFARGTFFNQPDLAATLPLDVAATVLSGGTAIAAKASQSLYLIRATSRLAKAIDGLHEAELFLGSLKTERSLASSVKSISALSKKIKVAEASVAKATAAKQAAFKYLDKVATGQTLGYKVFKGAQKAIELPRNVLVPTRGAEWIAEKFLHKAGARFIGEGTYDILEKMKLGTWTKFISSPELRPQLGKFIAMATAVASVRGLLVEGPVEYFQQLQEKKRSFDSTGAISYADLWSNMWGEAALGAFGSARVFSLFNDVIHLSVNKYLTHSQNVMYERLEKAYAGTANEDIIKKARAARLHPSTTSEILSKAKTPAEASAKLSEEIKNQDTVTAQVNKAIEDSKSDPTAITKALETANKDTEAIQKAKEETVLSPEAKAGTTVSDPVLIEKGMNPAPSTVGEVNKNLALARALINTKDADRGVVKAAIEVIRNASLHTPTEQLATIHADLREAEDMANDVQSGYQEAVLAADPKAAQKVTALSNELTKELQELAAKRLDPNATDSDKNTHVARIKQLRNMISKTMSKAESKLSDDDRKFHRDLAKTVSKKLSDAIKKHKLMKPEVLQQQYLAMREFNLLQFRRAIKAFERHSQNLKIVKSLLSNLKVDQDGYVSNQEDIYTIRNTLASLGFTTIQIARMIKDAGAYEKSETALSVEEITSMLNEGTLSLKIQEVMAIRDHIEERLLSPENLVSEADIESGIRPAQWGWQYEYVPHLTGTGLAQMDPVAATKILDGWKTPEGRAKLLKSLLYLKTCIKTIQTMRINTDIANQINDAEILACMPYDSDIRAINVIKLFNGAGIDSDIQDGRSRFAIDKILVMLDDYLSESPENLRDKMYQARAGISKELAPLNGVQLFHDKLANEMRAVGKDIFTKRNNSKYMQDTDIGYQASLSETEFVEAAKSHYNARKSELVSRANDANRAPLPWDDMIIALSKVSPEVALNGVSVFGNGTVDIMGAKQLGYALADFFNSNKPEGAVRNIYLNTEGTASGPTATVSVRPGTVAEFTHWASMPTEQLQQFYNDFLYKSRQRNIAAFIKSLPDGVDAVKLAKEIINRVSSVTNLDRSSVLFAEAPRFYTRIPYPVVANPMEIIGDLDTFLARVSETLAHLPERLAFFVHDSASFAIEDNVGIVEDEATLRDSLGVGSELSVIGNLSPAPGLGGGFLGGIHFPWSNVDLMTRANEVVYGLDAMRSADREMLARFMNRNSITNAEDLAKYFRKSSYIDARFRGIQDILASIMSSQDRLRNVTSILSKLSGMSDKQVIDTMVNNGIMVGTESLDFYSMVADRFQEAVFDMLPKLSANADMDPAFKKAMASTMSLMQALGFDKNSWTPEDRAVNFKRFRDFIKPEVVARCYMAGGEEIVKNLKTQIREAAASHESMGLVGLKQQALANGYSSVDMYLEEVSRVMSAMLVDHAADTATALQSAISQTGGGIIDSTIFNVGGKALKVGEIKEAMMAASFANLEKALSDVALVKKKLMSDPAKAVLIQQELARFQLFLAFAARRKETDRTKITPSSDAAAIARALSKETSRESVSFQEWIDNDPWGKILSTRVAEVNKRIAKGGFGQAILQDMLNGAYDHIIQSEDTIKWMLDNNLLDRDSFGKPVASPWHTMPQSARTVALESATPLTTTQDPMVNALQDNLYGTTNQDKSILDPANGPIFVKFAEDSARASPLYQRAGHPHGRAASKVRTEGTDDKSSFGWLELAKQKDINIGRGLLHEILELYANFGEFDIIRSMINQVLKENNLNTIDQDPKDGEFLSTWLDKSDNPPRARTFDNVIRNLPGDPSNNQARANDIRSHYDAELERINSREEIQLVESGYTRAIDRVNQLEGTYATLSTAPVAGFGSLRPLVADPANPLNKMGSLFLRNLKLQQLMRPLAEARRNLDPKDPMANIELVDHGFSTMALPSVGAFVGGNAMEMSVTDRAIQLRMHLEAFADSLGISMNDPMAPTMTQLYFTREAYRIVARTKNTILRYTKATKDPEARANAVNLAVMQMRNELEAINWRWDNMAENPEDILGIGTIGDITQDVVTGTFQEAFLKLTTEGNRGIQFLQNVIVPSQVIITGFSTSHSPEVTEKMTSVTSQDKDSQQRQVLPQLAHSQDFWGIPTAMLHMMKVIETEMIKLGKMDPEALRNDPAGTWTMAWMKIKDDPKIEAAIMSKVAVSMGNQYVMEMEIGEDALREVLGPNFDSMVNESGAAGLLKDQALAKNIRGRAPMNVKVQFNAKLAIQAMLNRNNASIIDAMMQLAILKLQQMPYGRSSLQDTRSARLILAPNAVGARLGAFDGHTVVNIDMLQRLHSKDALALAMLDKGQHSMAYIPTGGSRIDGTPLRGQVIVNAVEQGYEKKFEQDKEAARRNRRLQKPTALATLFSRLGMAQMHQLFKLGSDQPTEMNDLMQLLGVSNKFEDIDIGGSDKWRGIALLGWASAIRGLSTDPLVRDALMSYGTVRSLGLISDLSRLDTNAVGDKTRRVITEEEYNDMLDTPGEEGTYWQAYRIRDRLAARLAETKAEVNTILTMADQVSQDTSESSSTSSAASSVETNEDSFDDSTADLGSFGINDLIETSSSNSNISQLQFLDKLSEAVSKVTGLSKESVSGLADIVNAVGTLTNNEGQTVFSVSDMDINVDLSKPTSVTMKFTNGRLVSTINLGSELNNKTEDYAYYAVYPLVLHELGHILTKFIDSDISDIGTTEEELANSFADVIREETLRLEPKDPEKSLKIRGLLKEITKVANKERLIQLIASNFDATGEETRGYSGFATFGTPANLLNTVQSHLTSGVPLPGDPAFWNMKIMNTSVFSVCQDILQIRKGNPNLQYHTSLPLRERIALASWAIINMQYTRGEITDLKEGVWGLVQQVTRATDSARFLVMTGAGNMHRSDDPIIRLLTGYIDPEVHPYEKLMKPDALPSYGFRSWVNWGEQQYAHVLATYGRVGVSYKADGGDTNVISNALQSLMIIGNKPQATQADLATHGMPNASPGTVAAVNKMLKLFDTYQTDLIQVFQDHQKLPSTVVGTMADKVPYTINPTLKIGDVQMNGVPAWFKELMFDRLDGLDASKDTRYTAPMLYVAGLIPSISESGADARAKWVMDQIQARKNAPGTESPFLAAFVDDLNSDWFTPNLFETDPSGHLKNRSEAMDKLLLEKSRELFMLIDQGLLRTNGSASGLLPQHIANIRWNNHPAYKVAVQDARNGTTDPRFISELMDWNGTPDSNGGYRLIQSMHIAYVDRRNPTTIDELLFLRFVNRIRGRTSLITEGAEQWLPARADMDVAMLQGQDRTVMATDAYGNSKAINLFSLDVPTMLRSLQYLYADRFHLEGLRKDTGVKGITITDVLKSMESSINSPIVPNNSREGQRIEGIRQLRQSMSNTQGMALDRSTMQDSEAIDMAQDLRKAATWVWGAKQTYGIIAGELLTVLLGNVTIGGAHGLKNIVNLFLNSIRAVAGTLADVGGLNPFSTRLAMAKELQGTCHMIRISQDIYADKSQIHEIEQTKAPGGVRRWIDTMTKLILKPSVQTAAVLRHVDALQARQAATEMLDHICRFVNDTSHPDETLDAKARRSGLPADMARTMHRSMILTPDFVSGWKILQNITGKVFFTEMDAVDALGENVSLSQADRAKAAHAMRAMSLFEENWIRHNQFEREGTMSVKPGSFWGMLLSTYRSWPMMAFSARVMRDKHLKTPLAYWSAIGFYVIGEFLYNMLKLCALTLVAPDRASRIWKMWGKNPKTMFAIAMTKSPVFTMYGNFVSDMLQSSITNQQFGGYSVLPMQALGQLMAQPFKSYKGITKAVQGGQGVPGALMQDFVQNWMGYLPVGSNPMAHLITAAWWDGIKHQANFQSTMPQFHEAISGWTKPYHPVKDTAAKRMPSNRSQAPRPKAAVQQVPKVQRPEATKPSNIPLAQELTRPLSAQEIDESMLRPHE